MNSRVSVGSVLIAVLIVLLTGWFWKQEREKQAPPAPTETAVSSTLSVFAPLPAPAVPPPPTALSPQSSLSTGVSVSDQPAGDSVTLDALALQSDAWVAIHEDAAGVPGRILGAQLFPAGSVDGTVSLLRATESGMTYDAVIHAADGSTTFDLKADPILLGKDGKPVLATFRAL